MPVYIYGLFCPVAQQVRYIGKAKTPHERLKFHLYSCKNRKTYKDHWLFGLLETGLRPALIILRELGEGEDWAEAERAEITNARERGLPLTNLTVGGDGVAFTEEGRERFLTALKAPSRCRKISEGMKRFLSDPKERVRLSESNRRRGRDPAASAKQSDALKRYWADRGKSQSHLEANGAPEKRKRVSEACKRRWADPKFRARVLAAQKASRIARKGG